MGKTYYVPKGEDSPFIGKTIFCFRHAVLRVIDGEDLEEYRMLVNTLCSDCVAFENQNDRDNKE